VSDAWAVVAAALGSSALTLGGTFWLERWRSAKSDRAAATEQLSSACVQLTSHALTVALRARSLYETGLVRSGLSEGIDVLLHVRKPLDPMELTDWLLTDFRPVLEAQAVIESAGDQVVIRAAADVVVAAVTVLEAATTFAAVGQQRVGAHGGSGWWEAFKRLRPLHRDPDIERRTETAVRALGQEVRLFAKAVRERVGVGDAGAVVDAFPELFSDRDPPPNPRPPSRPRRNLTESTSGR
jgi:hypothetical protein